MSFFKGIGNKVGATFNQGNQQQGQENDQSLATLLNREQRAELSVLISQTTESMRKDLAKCFDHRPPQTVKDKPTEEEQPIDLSKLTLSDAGAAPDIVAEDDSRPQGSPDHETAQDEEAALAEQTPESKALQTSALEFFDVWAESVILRIGEVVNSRDHQEQDKNNHQTKKLVESADHEFRPTSRDQNVDNTLQTLYPPINTPLSKLSHLERSAILNALLLMLLSLETYRAHSRTFLLRLCTSISLSAAELTQMEKNTALGLLKIADASDQDTGMDASASTTKAQQSSSTARKWKVGVAGVAGAALIGITGGLAAPLLAAGVGTLMGGLGLGATAAAGYLGALAGNAALVGGLFGAYGARMTSRTMDKYAREIEDFAFVPLHQGNESSATETKAQIGTEKSSQQAPAVPPRKKDVDSNKPDEANHRLRLTVAITGWLTEPQQITLPWLSLSSDAETFSLRWELQALQDLGNALRNLVMSEAWGTLKKELIKRTVLAALYSAIMAPLAIRKVLKIVDSPFGLAKMRAMKAGEVLADALIERVQGERPVSLVGMSLGSRVIYSCLLALARRKAFGLVENVVMIGSAVPSDAEAWRAMRSVVTGRLINVYSSQDYILAVMYRATSAQLGIAGIQAVEGVSGVENFDVSELVGGHLSYMGKTGRVLEVVGWEDLDLAEIGKQEEAGQSKDGKTEIEDVEEAQGEKQGEKAKY